MPAPRIAGIRGPGVRLGERGDQVLGNIEGLGGRIRQPRLELGREYQATGRRGGLPREADRPGGLVGGDLRRFADPAARLYVHIQASALEAVGLVGGIGRGRAQPAGGA